MRVQAVLAGAGRGRRMEPSAGGKLWLPLGGEPLVARSLRAFAACDCVERIYLVVHPDDRARVEAEILPRVGGIRAAVVEGGKERQDSVAAALRVMAPDPERVLIHDVARPLVTPDLIRRVAKALERADGAVPVIAFADSVKEVAGGWVIRSWDRDKFAAVQTPQGFRLGVLRDVHERAAREGFRATDDAALLERYRFSVAAVPGERSNLKVTYPEDLAVAEALLRTRGGE